MRRLIVSGAAVLSLLAAPSAGQAAPPVCGHGLVVVDQNCLKPGTYTECVVWVSVDHRQVVCSTRR